MLYIVIQKPRQKYAHAYSSGFALVEARTKREAITKAKEIHHDYINEGSGDYLPPKAFEAVSGFRGFF